MPRIRRKTKSEQVGEPSLVICTEAFRPGAVARMVERGDYLRRDDPVVERFPAFFAVPLVQSTKAQ